MVYITLGLLHITYTVYYSLLYDCWTHLGYTLVRTTSVWITIDNIRLRYILH